MAEDTLIVLLDFAGTDAVEEWQAVNDGVMGGVTEGTFQITDRKTLAFFGTLSLENNGGFASVPTNAKTLGLESGDALRVRVRGDGRQYSLNLYLPRPQIAFSYRATVTTTTDEWVEVTLPLDTFEATSFGRPVRDAGPVDPQEVNALGFMLSDKRAGGVQAGSGVDHGGAGGEVIRPAPKFFHMRTTPMAKALLVIDVQNDYFPEGKFPLWNTEVVLQNVERAIAKANASGVSVVHVRHVARGVAPFFHEGTAGADIHPRILAAAPTAPVVVKAFADGFEKTTLEEMLTRLGVTELLVCGMMTQNCVTHTAISKAAEKYAVTILPDCCTTVSEILHLIALHALSTRVKLVPSDEAL